MMSPGWGAEEQSLPEELAAEEQAERTWTRLRLLNAIVYSLLTVDSGHPLLAPLPCQLLARTPASETERAGQEEGEHAVGGKINPTLTLVIYIHVERDINSLWVGARAPADWLGLSCSAQ